MILQNPYAKLAQLLVTEPKESTNYHISKKILELSHNLVKLTTNELSEQCNVSKPTIIRFCRSLGYENFSDFKWALISWSNLELKQYSPIEDKYNFFNDYLFSVHNSIDWIMENVTVTEIIKLSKLIFEARHVYLFGNAQAYASASNLMRKLLIQGKYSVDVSSPLLHVETFQQMEANSLAIVLSVTGDFWSEFPEDFFSKHKKNGQSIYLLTCQVSDATPKEVDEIIYCGNKTGLDGGNLSIDIILNLLIQYYGCYPN